MTTTPINQDSLHKADLQAQIDSLSTVLQSANLHAKYDSLASILRMHQAEIQKFGISEGFFSDILGSQLFYFGVMLSLIAFLSVSAVIVYLKQQLNIQQERHQNEMKEINEFLEDIELNHARQRAELLRTKASTFYEKHQYTSCIVWSFRCLDWVIKKRLIFQQKDAEHPSEMLFRFVNDSLEYLKLNPGEHQFRKVDIEEIIAIMLEIESMEEIDNDLDLNRWIKFKDELLKFHYQTTPQS